MKGLIAKIIILVVAIIIIIKYLTPALMAIGNPWGSLLVAIVWLTILWYILSGQLKIPE